MPACGIACCAVKADEKGPHCTCAQDMAKCMKHVCASLLIKGEEKACRPDGGYGWVVVMASFLLQSLSVGMAFSVGVYYVAFLEAFNERKGHTAWISSINTGLLFGAGPLASILTNRFGHRNVVMVGGVLTTAGMCISSYAPNIYFLYISYGVITGFGFCFAYIPSVVIVGLYFNKRRSLAMGIAVSGCGAGSLVFAPLFQYLVDYWGWRGALLLSAGISAHTCVLGALLRPIEEHIPSLKRNKMKSAYHVSSLFELSLLKDSKFIIFLINNVLWNIGSLILFVVIPDYAFFNGITMDDSAFLLSCIGICNFMGRLIVAFLSSHKSCNRLAIFVISTAVTGLAIAAFPLSRDYLTLMVFSGLYGLFFGMQLGVLAVVTVELFGVSRITSAYGYLMFGNGAGALIGPPLAGWLFDETQSYVLPFYLGGGVTLLSAVLLLAIPVIKYSETKKNKTRETIVDADIQDEKMQSDTLVSNVC